MPDREHRFPLAEPFTATERGRYAPVHTADGWSVEPADEACACPADGLPMVYAPAHGLHACQDPGCEHAHPGDRDA
jgi:hypothetical protein